MQQLEFFDIPSPCVGVCESNSKGYCKGCLRSRNERLLWNRLDNSDKKIILQRCLARRVAIYRDQINKSNTIEETSDNPQTNIFNLL